MLTVQKIKDTVTDYFKDKPVKEVYLYGSYARGDERNDSDVDLLVEYDYSKEKLSFSDLLDIKINLEEVFCNKVDLVEDRLMYPRIKRNIEADKILIFSKERIIPDKIQPKKILKGKFKRDYVVNLEIILSSIEKIFSFIHGVNETAFIEDNLLKDACMGQLMILGTHAEKLSPEIREKFTDTEWQAMNEQKKFFDIEVVYTNWRNLWKIVNSTLPNLKPKIENIIDILEKEKNAETN